ncbi:hypothetical protein JCM24511_07303 [Saitozyma sp. JCM 24511]|nr:hypothetical protein JCM24511_07303 [Saitozyma sp. JCM 24511]
MQSGGVRRLSTRSTLDNLVTTTATALAISRGAIPQEGSTLGIDAVWFSLFYPSALIDGGYDVAHYRDVDPRIGTLADFDQMAAA